jgi:beta-carotene 15,15'-dioxygenase
MIYGIMKSNRYTKQFNIEYVLLIVGLATIAIHFFVFAISLDAQMIILLSLVFLVGVPHGALDFLVDEQNDEVVNKTFSIKKFVAIYLFRLFIFSLLWMLPWLAFSLFIIFSIFHFGETDMSSIMKPNKSSIALYIAYGAFILSLLLLTHVKEIEAAVPIIGTYLQGSFFYDFIQKYTYLIVAVFAATFVTILLWQRRKNNIVKIDIWKIVQFGFLIFIISTLPMLLAFTFYFALWHSILSVRNIFSYFKSFNNAKKFVLICNKSILFSLLALGSIIGLYFGLHYFIPDMNLLFALLIVLSVLTLPHLTVMHSMYKNYSRNLYPSLKP